MCVVLLRFGKCQPIQLNEAMVSRTEDRRRVGGVTIYIDFASSGQYTYYRAGVLMVLVTANRGYWLRIGTRGSRFYSIKNLLLQVTESTFNETFGSMVNF